MFTRFYRDFRLASGRLAREEDVLGREVFPACRAGKLLNLLEGLSTTLEKAQTVQACFGQKQIVVAHLVPLKPASNSHLTIWSWNLEWPSTLRRTRPSTFQAAAKTTEPKGLGSRLGSLALMLLRFFAVQEYERSRKRWDMICCQKHRALE